MPNLKYSVYRSLRVIFPKSLRERLLNSSLADLARRLTMRDKNDHLTKGRVDWEDLSFEWRATFSWLYKAQNKGIENRICRLARACLKPGDMGIDVGCNYGFVSTVMALSVAPNGRILSFELSGHEYETAVENFRDNGLDQVVTLLHKGAGDQTKGMFVKVDDAMADIGNPIPKFYKIDVDGEELSVLRGSEQTLKKNLPLLVVELTKDEAAIFDFLKQCGYRHFMDQNGDPLNPEKWPLNIIASNEPWTIPPRGAFKKNA